MEKNLLDLYETWGNLAKPYFKWQFDQFSPYLGQRVGDIGCGQGNFAPFLKNKKLYLGFEIEEALTKRFKQAHPDMKLADHGDITSFEAVNEIKIARLDSILCVNVLEHIKDDALALSNMIKGVNVGGYICILVPALPWLYGSLDQVAPHYRRYTKNGLRKLLKETGQENIEVVQCYYMNFIGIFGWFLKGKILKEKTHKDENYKVMNRLLPAVSACERLIKPPIGMSLVMVLKKL